MGLLRFILALSVVTAHCGGILGSFNFIGGELAVQVFFMISGFYMSMVLESKYKLSIKGYKLFITNRLLRLYPIYWVVLTLTLFVFLLYKPYFFSQFSKLSFSSNLYMIFTNFFLFFQDIVLFLGISSDNGNIYFTTNFQLSNPPLYHFLLVPQGWSLGIELLFYVTVPFIVKLKSNTILTLIVFSLLLRLVLYSVFNLNIDPWTYRFFPNEILFFLLGIMSQRNSNRIISIFKTNPIYFQFFLMGYIFFYFRLPEFKINIFPFSFNSTLLFLLVYFTTPILFNYYKKVKWDRYIGELSFPIYISHMFISYLVNAMWNDSFKSETVILGTILLSIILVHFISNPVERFRQNRIQLKSN
jgi:peptidoglycan/LPS O-acetylase OafA/YrhL